MSELPGKDQERNEEPPPIKTWSSAELLGDAHEARIEHNGEVYRLMRTRNDKLILVK